MRFETRELKEHSEPVAVERLREGTTYFSLSFLDKEMLVPTLEPVVFVGCNLEPDDEERLFYFQDADSYRAGIRYHANEPDADDADATFYSGAVPSHIFEYEHALDLLLVCSLRRKKHLDGR